MFSIEERTQLRAALALWKETANHSRTHPASLPVCNAIFMMEDTLPLSDENLEVLMLALEQDVVYVSVASMSVTCGLPRHRIRRELSRMEAFPVPGTRLYSITDMLLSVQRIRARDRG